MHLDWDASPVVPDGNGAIRVDGNVNPCTVAGEMFVDGIVEYFKNTMMKSSLIGITDVHAGAFANCFQTLKFVNLGGTVNIASSSVLFLGNIAVVERNDWFGRRGFGHGRCWRFSIPSEGEGELFVTQLRVGMAGVSGNAFFCFSEDQNAGSGALESWNHKMWWEVILEDVRDQRSEERGEKS
jgi:hypothetical protein